MLKKRRGDISIMNAKPILIFLLILALTSMACSVTINLPEQDVKTGPTVVDDIRVEAPSTGESVNLTLAFGAGKLRLSPGAGDRLVSGTATYNIPDFKPTISTTGNLVRIEQGDLELRGLPSFGSEPKNEWDLQLGQSPMSLRVTAGAYKGDYELGGLSIEDLEISDGAADSHLVFSEPNLVAMDTLRYTTGASSVHLEGLANANFSEMYFRSGAGSYTLDFSGEFMRDATVTIESGLGNVVIILPPGVAGRVTFEGSLSNVDMSGEWQQVGDEFVQNGSGPQVIFIVKLGLGNLDLRSR
jgi:hypothetical protein